MSSLDQWLSVATHRLSPESAGQVRTEIQEHYGSAIASGANAEEVVQALGSPEAANREYRKVLLTEVESAMAPAFAQRKPPSLRGFLFSTVAFALLAWWLAGGKYGGVVLPVLIAQWLEMPLRFLIPATTPERNRVLLRFLLVRDVIVIGVAWRFQGWIGAVSLGVLLIGLRMIADQPRTNILRKLAAGQTFSPFPGEPALTHHEAILLNTFRKGDPSQKYGLPVVFAMLIGLAIWVPLNCAPIAVAMIASFSIPWLFPVVYTPKWSQWYRIGKWASLVVASVLPVFLGAKAPWVVAPFVAYLCWMFEWKRISLRRKLPMKEWPKELYL